MSDSAPTLGIVIGSNDLEYNEYAKRSPHANELLSWDTRSKNPALFTNTELTTSTVVLTLPAVAVYIQTRPLPLHALNPWPWQTGCVATLSEMTKVSRME